MSNLLTGIAPQAGLIAQSSGPSSVPAAKAASGTAAQAQVIQTAVTSGAVSNSAAVVSLSTDSKARSASYGEGRSVDASFEKNGHEERLSTSKDEDSPSGKKQSAVNVTA